MALFHKTCTSRNSSFKSFKSGLCLELKKQRWDWKSVNSWFRQVLYSAVDWFIDVLNLCTLHYYCDWLCTILKNLLFLLYWGSRISPSCQYSLLSRGWNKLHPDHTFLSPVLLSPIQLFLEDNPTFWGLPIDS